MFSHFVVDTLSYGNIFVKGFVCLVLSLVSMVPLTMEAGLRPAAVPVVIRGHRSAYNSLVIPRSRGLVVACTANFVMCVRLGLGRQRWKCGGERGVGLMRKGGAGDE